LNVDDALGLARAGRLYPSLILHGGSAEARLLAAESLARALLCLAEPASRPCGACRNCRRIAVADAESTLFHPDVGVLRRDLKTSTSVDATRELLRLTQQSPFEARGQVLVIAEAESLTPEAANALLKQLEEPPTSAPRHFLLLARARDELLPTLRSRSWAVWLGPSEALDEESIAAVAAELGTALAAFRARPTPLYLLAAAAALAGAGGWEDIRAERPWALAAAAVLRCARQAAEPAERRALLALAEDVLDGSRFRLRSVPAPRILDGLVCRHLGGLVPTNAGLVSGRSGG
jgi:DNA polymerase-3 subunit delta'